MRKMPIIGRGYKTSENAEQRLPMLAMGKFGTMMNFARVAMQQTTVWTKATPKLRIFCRDSVLQKRF